MGVSSSPGLLVAAESEAQRVKIDEKKDLHPFLPFGRKAVNTKSFLRPFVFSNIKFPHQFSCEIQVRMNK